MSDILLQARDVVKRFGGVVANDGVSLTVREGEIHALMGENGAGKSTLVNILYGLAQADAGSIEWRGQPLNVKNPAQARALGIGVVFQKFSLFEPLTVMENLRLAVRMAEDDMRRELQTLGERYGLRVSAHRLVAELSAGERQRVEIIRSLLQKPTLLIMDEPTSVLTPAEVQQLFDLLRALAADGCAILFISHKMKEIEALCERATVLRRGRVAGEVAVANSSRADLIGLMLGDAPSAGELARRDGAAAGQETLLQVRGARRQCEGLTLRVENLTLKRGCITGVAGIAGNGQDELLKMINGEMTSAPDTVLLDGKPIGRWGAARRGRAGVLSAPTDRYRAASVGALSLAENSLLGCIRPAQLAPRGFLRPDRLREFADDVIAAFQVKVDEERGAMTRARELSGGNLQKFIIGRAVRQTPRVFAAANPTWGVDVASARFIRRALRDMADAGAALMVISEDLDELFEVADEIAVINNGVLSAPLTMSEELSLMAIGELMASDAGAANSPAAAEAEA